jgi:hypothetical protein
MVVSELMPEQVYASPVRTDLANADVERLLAISPG